MGGGEGKYLLPSRKYFQKQLCICLLYFKDEIWYLTFDDCSEISGHQILGISPTGTNAFSHFSNNDIHFDFYLGSVTCPAKSNAAFKPGEKYPLLVFSHGLGAFR